MKIKKACIHIIIIIIFKITDILINIYVHINKVIAKFFLFFFNYFHFLITMMHSRLVVFTISSTTTTIPSLFLLILHTYL
jgi:hypothetical protein